MQYEPLLCGVIIMKIRVEILKSDDENPNNEEYYGYFEDVKCMIEASLTKYAKNGILPSVNDEIVGEHKDNTITMYKVFSKTFYEDEILIFVEWF